MDTKETKLTCVIKTLGDVARIVLGLNVVTRTYQAWPRLAKRKGKREEP
jgi:hypothetical protein